MFDSLPDLIVSDILSRLNTESISHCKLVQKTWQSLICTNRHFALSHSRHIYNDDSVAAIASHEMSFIDWIGTNKKSQMILKHLYYHDDMNWKKALKFKIINLLPPTNANSIVGSSNGLICISVMSEKNIQDPIYVCNPVTKEYVYLPKLSVNNLRSKDYVVSGFGYNHFTNEYKVVRIYYRGTRSRRNEHFVGRVEVYTLGSGNGWRNIEDITHELYPISYSCEILVDGTLHWLSKQGNIVAFDLADEKFHIIPTRPDCMHWSSWDSLLKMASKDRHYDPAWFYELRVLSGHLCIIYRSSSKGYQIFKFKSSDDLSKQTTRKRKDREDDHEKDIGKLQEKYKSSWIYQEVSFGELAKESAFAELYPFAIVKDETLLYHDNESYLRQDLRGSRSLNRDYEYIGGHHKPNRPVRYVKSFVSLKALGEKTQR